MADELDLQIGITPEPTGEVSPESAELKVSGTPATLEEDNEIAALDAAIEAAPTPEAKKSAQDKRNTAWAQSRRERQAAKEEAAKAREEAAFYRGQAEALQKGPAVPPVQIAPVQPELVFPPEPRIEDFDDGEGSYDYPKFYAATGKWGAECKFIERDANRAVEEKQRQQEQTAQAQLSWEQQGEAKFPGFKNKIETRMMPILKPLDPVKFQALSGALSESALSHDLAVYLSDNPTELRALAGMKPFAAIKEIGRLEQKLEKPKPKTTTSAPSPITPVQTGGEAITDIMDLEGDEYLNAVKAKVQREGRGALYR